MLCEIQDYSSHERKGVLWGEMWQGTHRNPISGSKNCNSPEVIIWGPIRNHQKSGVCVTQFIALINKSYPPMAIGQPLQDKRECKSAWNGFISASSGLFLSSNIMSACLFDHRVIGSLPIYNKDVKSIIQTTWEHGQNTGRFQKLNYLS